MARLHTCGFEMQLAQGEVSSLLGAPAISTAQARSGAASLVVTGASHQNVAWEWVGVLGRAYFARVWFFSAVTKPTNMVLICNLANTEFAYAGSVRFNTDGTLSLNNLAGTQVGSKTAAIEANRWYCVELEVKVAAAPTTSNGAIRARLDGVEFAGSAATNAGIKAINYLYGVDTTGAIGGNFFIDDVAANDDQGENQNSYSSPAGKVVILRPTSDVGRDAGWLAGGGGTTNLWAAVDNAPPTGVALGSATNTSQIKDAVNNATDVYEPGLQNYTTYMATTDKTLLVQALARGGNSTTTSRNLAIQATVNPVITEVTVGSGATAAATEPTGWTTVRTAYLYNPSTNFEFEPRIKVRKGTASTDSLMYDFMGLLVEYQPVPLVPLAAASGSASTTLALSAETQIPLGAASGSSSTSLALSAETKIPLNPASGSSSTSLALKVRQVLQPRLPRQAPPMRLYIAAITPSGRTYRWGEDEIGDSAFSDLSDSDSVPGGYKELTCTLPRKPNVDYSDMAMGTKIKVFGAGGIQVGEYRLERAPRTSGNEISIDPAAYGYQGHLSDDESARAVFIDADLSAWTEASAARKLKAFAANLKFDGDMSVAFQVTGEAAAALVHHFSTINSTSGGQLSSIESWYYGGGAKLARLLFNTSIATGITPGNANWDMFVSLSDDDVLTTADSTADLNATVTTQGEVKATGERKYARLRTTFNATLSSVVEAAWQWEQLKVLGDHGLTLYGTWPEVGLLASDIIAWAISRWAPLLNYTTGQHGSIRPTSFAIPHLAFKEAGAIADWVTQTNRFELNEWAVWNDQTFYLNPRGEREGRKRWIARSGPAQLQETGEQMERAFNGVVVEYQDVSGEMRSMGPPNSFATYTDTRLEDHDPENIVNQISGLKRWAKISANGASTPEGARRIGELFLAMAKELDHSGSATIQGYIEDEHGSLWPYYCVHAGDLISFVDSSSTGWRYIINAQRSRADRSVAIDLDAPPDAMAALLERLDVVLVGLTS